MLTSTQMPPVDLNSHVTHLAQSNPDCLVSASNIGEIQKWSIAEDNMTCIARFSSPNENSPIIALQALTDGYVVVGYESNAIEIWNINGKIPIFTHTFNPSFANSGLGQLVTLTTLSNGYLACGFSSGTIRVWHLNCLNLVRLANKQISDEQTILSNLGIEQDQIDFPLSLLSANGNNLVSVHYPSDQSNKAGFIKIWQINIEAQELQLQGTIRYPSYAGRINALTFLPNNVIVTARGTKLSVSKLEKDIDRNVYALLPIQSLVPNIIVDAGINHLLNSADPEKFFVITPAGSAQLWEISSPKPSIFKHATPDTNVRPIQDLDIGEGIGCSPRLLTNGYLISSTNSRIQLQKTKLCQPVSNTSRLSAILDIVTLGEEVVPKSFPRIPSSNLRDKQLLGEGSFGEAYKAKLPNSIEVAVKLAKTAKGRNVLLEELKLHVQLSHENVVSMHGISQEEGTIYLVMELMVGGDLFDLLNPPSNKKTVPLKNRLDIALNVIEGLIYLHRLNIIYRDLKPENVFLNHKGQAKIADFGLAKKWDRTKPGVPGLAGTPEYLATEVWLQNISNIHTDIFAFGVFMWDLVTYGGDYLRACNLPERGSNKLIGFLRDGHRAKIPDQAPEQLKSMITRLWDQRADERLPLESAKQEIESYCRQEFTA